MRMDLPTFVATQRLDYVSEIAVHPVIDPMGVKYPLPTDPAEFQGLYVIKQTSFSNADPC